jgi:hypothetical protein
MGSVWLVLNLVTYHTHAGYPGIQHSGNDISFAPLLAASETRAQVFLTEASKSSHSGSACVTAMRIDAGDVWAVDMLVRYDDYRYLGQKCLNVAPQYLSQYTD